MRFEITGVLDTIEQHLSTDIAVAQAVIDLSAAARLTALDHGRPVNLLRIGLVVDALARHLGESGVMIYLVVGRDLMADVDLTSKERMVLGRWAGDGLIEVLPAVADRAVEVADLTGLPLITPEIPLQFVDRYPWLVRQPERVLRLQPDAGGAILTQTVAPDVSAPAAAGPRRSADPTKANVLGHVWRCPRPDCPDFGVRRAATQGAPGLRTGVPRCLRHDEPLALVGPRPPAVAMAVVVDGVVRQRFAVRSGAPTVVGRRPPEQPAVALAPWLLEDAARWISRRHLQLDLHDDTLVVTDHSTNGTVVLAKPTQHETADEVELSTGQSYQLNRWDTLRLHSGVELGRVEAFVTPAQAKVDSVMAEAPTIALRPR